MEDSAPALPGKISRTERGWVIRFAIGVMLLTLLPYLVGYAVQGTARGADFRFTGFVIGVEDGNSYIAKMLSGMYGAWLFRTPYSAFPQMGVIMFLPYLLLGKLASNPGAHEQLVGLFHLFRLAAGFLAIWASYDFLAFFVGQVKLRRLGLCLITLGGGLGWVLALMGRDWWLGSLPLDFNSPETFGFLGLLGIPHLALVRALILWAVLAYLRFWTGEVIPGQELRNAGQLSGLWLLSGLLQPLSALVIGFVIGLHTGGMLLWNFAHQPSLTKTPGAGRKRVAGWVLLAGIPPGLFVFYNAWALSQDMYLQGWTAQNLVLSPHPLHYLLAYGLILPFAIWGGITVMRKNGLRGWLLTGWGLALPLLAYLPITLQRRLPEGEWVVWVTLAMLGVQSVLGRGIYERKLLRGLVFLPFLLAFVSTLFLLLGTFRQASGLRLPAFRPGAEVAAFDRLREVAQPGEVILAAYETGNALPAWAPVRVLIGHGPESADLAELLRQVKAFYGNDWNDAQRLDLLRRWEVRYVFWGPAERRLGLFDPDLAGFLKWLATEGEYAIFEVVADADPK